MANKPNKESLAITFLTVPMEGGQDRLVLVVFDRIVCRAPSLRPGTTRHTTPGSAAWVLSENSKAVRRLERQLQDGSRVTEVYEEGDIARLEESVRTGASFLSEERLASLVEERAGVLSALNERREARAEAAAAKKRTRRPGRAPKAEMLAISPEALEALLARIKALEAAAEEAATTGAAEEG